MDQKIIFDFISEIEKCSITDKVKVENNGMYGYSFHIELTETEKDKLKIEIGNKYRTNFWVYIDIDNLGNGEMIPIYSRMFFGLIEGNILVGDYSKIKNSSLVPLPVESHSFYFDKTKNRIVNRKGKIIAIDELKDKLLSLHYYYLRQTKINKFISSIVRRTKMVFYQIIKYMSLFTRGKYINKVERYSDERVKAEYVSGTTSLYGFKVSEIPFIAFSILLAIGFILCYWKNIKPDILRIIMKYNLLTIVFSILLYLFYERIIGGFFFFLCKKVNKWAI